MRIRTPILSLSIHIIYLIFVYWYTHYINLYVHIYIYTYIDQYVCVHAYLHMTAVGDGGDGGWCWGDMFMPSGHTTDFGVYHAATASRLPCKKNPDMHL